MQRCVPVLVALTLCAGAASAQNVKVDWDRATDFALYKTYKWAKIPSPRTPAPAIEKLIQDVADTHLQARGLKKIETGEPDVLVGYSVALAEPKKQASAPSNVDSSPWQAASSWSAQTSSDEAARKGRLNIDLADAKKNQLIWRGSVQAEVGDSVNDARVKVARGIGKAFVKYPPPAK